MKTSIPPVPAGLARRPGFTARFLRSPSSLTGLGLLFFIVLLAVLAGALFAEDPLSMVAEPFIPPLEDKNFPLGTDMLGRDIAAGIFHGARVSLLIGVVATLVSLCIGIGVGVVSGYYGGFPRAAFMRLTELFQTVPPFLFALAVVAILQPSIPSIVLAIGLTSWSGLARLVRAEVLKLRQGELVQVSIALGASDARIIFLHILPNVLAPVVVSTSMLVAGAILTESALSFLGLGDPNVVSWGAMVGAGREVLRTDWHVAVIPGIVIIISVLALNLLGDGLNDALSAKR
jgi:peptide/nickel transport system permease protein